MEPIVAAFVDSSERHYRERIRLVRLRDSSNPFEMAEAKFIKIFRLPKTGVRFLLEILDGPRLEKGSIPKIIKVLATLKFFGHGSYQTSTGQDNFLGLSQPTVSRCIKIVVEEIVGKLAFNYVKFPTTPLEKETAMAEFQDLYGMPHTLGAVDGTHVAIAKPPISHPTAPGNLFFNRKRYHSINCQIVCSAKGKIVALNPNFPGSTHDAAIWGASSVCLFLKREFVQGECQQWLLGDKGYPLQPWLMTPLINPTTNAEEAYNASHIRARNIVEMTIGRLKNKFRCLHRHRCLHYKPEKAAKIIISCCTLYNMFKDEFSDMNENIDIDIEDVLVEEYAMDSFRRTVPETQNILYADDQMHISRITKHAEDLIRILPDLVSQITRYAYYQI